MGYAIVNSEGQYTRTWSLFDNPPRPLEGGESVVEVDDPSTLPQMPEPVVVPESITKYQATKWLRDMGLYESLMTTLGQDQDALDRWNLGTSLLRSDPIVVGLGLQLGLTIEQLDAAFITASQIQ